MTHTTTRGLLQKAMTLEDVEKMAAVLRDMPPEPIGQWMRERGHPPEKWTLWLPANWKQDDSTLWPSYVLFSGLLDKPMFIARNFAFGG